MNKTSDMSCYLNTKSELVNEKKIWRIDNLLMFYVLFSQGLHLFDFGSILFILIIILSNYSKSISESCRSRPTIVSKQKKIEAWAQLCMFVNNWFAFNSHQAKSIFNYDALHFRCYCFTTRFHKNRRINNTKSALC